MKKNKMMKFYTLLVISLLLSCQQKNKETRSFSNFDDSTDDSTIISLSVNTEAKIDSVFLFEKFTNSFIALPFSDTLKAKFDISKPSAYTIMYQSGNQLNSHLPILLNNGKIHIFLSISNNKIDIDSIIGAPLYYEAKNFYETYDQIVKTNDSESINTFLLNAFEINSDNLFSQEIASQIISNNLNNKPILKNLLNKINAQDSLISNHKSSVKLELTNKINFNNVELSRYSFINRSGDEVNFKFEKTKTYLIDFWFSKCAPCIKDHKKIMRELDFFEKNKIEVLSISTEASFDDWSDYLKKNDYPWINLKEITPSASTPRLSIEAGVALYPTYLWVNSNGEVLSASSKIDDFIYNFSSK